MFYLDIWEGIIPHWVPVLGGQAMSLWPIFNVADSAIFIGVLIILFNQKRFFSSLPDRKTPEVESAVTSRPEPSGAEMEA
jgi:signal peptidase II